MDINIILLKQEIIRDIQSDIGRLERTRKMETPILTEDESDMYDLCRSIDDALGDAIDNMQAYLKFPSQLAHTISTNHTEDWDEKSIWLSLPDNWPAHLTDSLQKSVHRYIVRKTELYLLTTVIPEDPFTVMASRFADTHYNAITSLLSARIGPIKIQPTIFG